MQVIPAVDLKAGKVVRAVAGRRDTYRPVESCFAEGAQPDTIGSALVSQFGFRQAYVADLDAIDGAEPAWDIYGSLLQCGLALWIDAGLSDAARTERMVDFAHDHSEVNGIIAGLETLPDQPTLEKILALVGAECFIFGLDMRGGRALTRSADWNGKIASEVAAVAVDAGAKRIVVIDVASVGMHGGCETGRICHLLKRRFPDVQLATGGGVRGIDDLFRLAEHGCSAALVSSALHDGWLSAEDLAEFERA